MSRFFVKDITVSGSTQNVAVSKIEFEDGVNIVHGPSNTGKSYILGCLNFMFGGMNIPFSKADTNYDVVAITFASTDGKRVCCKRMIVEGRGNRKEVGSNIIEFTLSDVPEFPVGDYYVNSAKKNARPYSEFLLFLLGITQTPQIISTKKRETNALSLRTIFQFFYLDEDNIFKKDTVFYPNHTFVNEFVIYKRTLQASQELDLENEKMFAMITFKNLYPKDFADIQFERGIIKDAFNGLSAAKFDIAESKKISISEKQTKIESIKQESLTSVRELKSAMLSALCNWTGVVTNLSGNSGIVASVTILDDDFDIQKLIDGHYLQVTYKSYDSGNSKSLKINNDTLKEYCCRIKEKELFTVDKETQLHNEIEMLKKDLYSIESLNAVGMLHKYSECLDDNKKITFLHKNPFLLFAIRRGYIDETYANYINYFQGESLTREDMNFILSIKNHRALEPTHSLTRIDRIVNQLQVFEFKQREILNYSLLKELLSKQTQTYTDKTNAFLSQFSGEDDVYWRFIESFVQETDYQDRFVMHLTNNWNGFWEFIYCNPAISDDKKAFYLALILRNATIIRIKEMDSNKSISNYMINHEDILVRLSSLDKSNHIKVDETKIIEVIAELNIKFENLDTNGVPSTILDYIYKNNYYIINYQMIYCIVNFKNSSKAEFLSTQNYTTILSVGYEPLITNIHDHFNDYIHDIVLSDTNIEEDESAVCSILEKCIDDLDTCVQVIEHEKISFESIEDCCSNLLEQNESAVRVLWDALLNGNKVSSTWRNVLKYWNAFQFTQELETFIEKNANILHADSSPVESEEFIRSFINVSVNYG